MVSVWKMFAIFGIVSTWAEKALEDKKVTLREATDLVESLAVVLGVPTEVDVSERLPQSEEPETRDEHGKTL